ncbi:MAG: Stk1 family PASTA domain-containing Ser/Thr kinase [Nocardioidaceae bacterium]
MSNGYDSSGNGSPDRPRIGSRYEIGELLGRGGMAEVRKGTDVRLGRIVAVKRLRTDLASDPTFQARFRREAQSAASLNHPAIVSVYDTGEEMSTDGTDVAQPYIVMEYVAGRTLREIIREGRKILPERALEITSGVLAALDYSHRAGIVHRDIKPANVMLTPAGDVKVMDFGIARAVADASSTMTQTAAVVGTAQYLSPEQARGETVDSRSDVYSTGCLLYELLVGRPPFVGESPVSVAYQHVREQAQPPSSLDPDLPPEIDAIVMKALAKRIEDRYQSASAMRADIERFLAGKPVVAPVVPVGDDATSFIPTDDPQQSTSLFSGTEPDDEEDQRRKKWPLALVALGILLLLILAVVLGSSLFKSAPPQVSVPSVVGMTRAKAVSTLQSHQLSLGHVTRSASTDVPKGHVVAQDPQDSSFVAPHSAVDLTLSTGRPDVVVPYVIGEDKNTAVQDLHAKGLKAKLIMRASDQPRGTVIDSSPHPADSVSSGSVVTLYWASGPRRVPNVVGLQRGAAERRISAAGFKTRVQFDSTTGAPKGQVISQSPGGFTPEPQGSTVTITVSSFQQQPTPTPTPTPTASPTPTPSQTASSPPSTFPPSP